MSLPSPRIVSSRRLMGPSLFDRREGAVLEIAEKDETNRSILVALWEAAVEHLLESVGWGAERTIVRLHPGGGQCFLTAPIDGLMAATEVAEQGWILAERMAAGQRVGIADVTARVHVMVQHDRRPRLVALQRATAARGLAFTFDDDEVTVGSGRGAATWPLDAVPDECEVAWEERHDIPLVLVTGSNGKTTTTRLIAAMLRRAGHVVGLTSTDGVRVGDEGVTHGDWSGPAGARLVLRDHRVTAAVLETARGGILRRGLAVARADVAVITRVTADHFGEYGVTDLATLAAVKLVTAGVVPPTGRVILNADDAVLREGARGIAPPVTWFSMRDDDPFVLAHVAAGGRAAFVAGDTLVLARDGRRESLGAVTAMPLTLGGAARHNVANAVAAVAGADALGVPLPLVCEVLATFGRSPDDNPGRLVLLVRDGVTAVLDYVHNPDGWEAMHQALGAFPAARRLVVVGQAGDRDDGALEALARAVWLGKPDLVFLKEMESLFRGRRRGETSDVIASTLRALGATDAMLERHDDEPSAIAAALATARAGDLVVLSVHEDYDGTMDVLRRGGFVPYGLGR